MKFIERDYFNFHHRGFLDDESSVDWSNAFPQSKRANVTFTLFYNKVICIGFCGFGKSWKMLEIEDKFSKIKKVLESHGKCCKLKISFLVAGKVL